MEDSESEYEKDLTVLDKEFLCKLKSAKDKTLLEKEYKEKLKKALEKYSRNLEKQNIAFLRNIPKNKQDSSGNQRVKPLKVPAFNSSLGFKEKLLLNYNKLKFLVYIRLRELHGGMPLWLKISFIRFRLFFIKGENKTLEYSKSSPTKILNPLQEFFMKIISFFKESFLKFFLFFNKPKPEDIKASEKNIQTKS